MYTFCDLSWGGEQIMGFGECVYGAALELMNIWQILLPETYQEMMMGLGMSTALAMAKEIAHA